MSELTETIMCRSCGFLLYFGENISYRLYHRLKEEDVLEGYHNRCPKCGSPLSPETVMVDVSPRGKQGAN